MTTYRLKDEGYGTFKKIYHGRKWVGRVCKHATKGGYLGIIGAVTVHMPTEIQAFDEAAARHMGYNSAAELRARNKQVRSDQRVKTHRAKFIVSEMMRGNFKPLDQLTGLEDAIETVKVAKEIFK